MMTEKAGRLAGKTTLIMAADLGLGHSTPGLFTTVGVQVIAAGTNETTLADFVDRQPMGRIGSPHEKTSLALYPTSDDSAFTTGQTHATDGGRSI